MSALQDHAAYAAADKVQDEVAAFLIAEGFVPNLFVLDLNHFLTAPLIEAEGFPWNLHSRTIRHPITVSRFDGINQRTLALLHPALEDHPFVKRVEAAIGYKLQVREYGDNGRAHKPGSAWAHAIDLVARGDWKDLVNSLQFTATDAILEAVGLCLGRSCDGITVKDARELLKALDVTEPPVSPSFLVNFREPRSVTLEGGALHWEVEHHQDVEPTVKAWARIHGLENGWFGTKGGFLTWTQAGRDRFASREAEFFADANTGQMAFNF